MNANETSQLTVRRWAEPAEAPAGATVFMLDGADLPADLSNIMVVVPEAGAARARHLLAAGAHKVLLGEAALLDSSTVKQLADEFGSERVGVWLPAKRMEVSWSLDLDSNADFRCLTPSVGTPSWEVLRGDGSRTGTEIAWWAEQMLGLGASLALVGVFDFEHDQDLNICAGLVERFGNRLWLTPLGNMEADLVPLVRFGRARQLALSGSRNDDLPALLQQALAAEEEEAFA
jgi:hypothetical protein